MKRRLILIGGMLTGAGALVCIFALLLMIGWWPFLGEGPRRRITEVQPRMDLRDCSLTGLDLRAHAEALRSSGFNLHTQWPELSALPPDFEPRLVLTNSMNPGLGIRALHQSGITGRGVSVAIIDYPIPGKHPEYASRISAIHRVGGARGSSMHGPAVASLLVGHQCGTAPGARLYFIATPDPGMDARHQAEALRWVLQQNEHLPPAEKIRVVSVSSGPSGPGSVFRNGTAWDEAVQSAEAAGVLVVDGTLHHGFLGPCNLDPLAPEDPSRCQPVPTQRGSALFTNRLLVPVGPRTVAEEYEHRSPGYKYCGLMASTRGMFGTSWTMPYCAGVLAMGWQVNPSVPAARMKNLLFETARRLPNGALIIDPPAFIAAVRRESCDNRVVGGGR
jgi:hypothetical protein